MSGICCYNGFINMLKPVGFTSSDMVVKIKHMTKAKVGHLGTLDPGASGVLPIAINQGTKLFDFLTFKRKKYRACFTFGTTTDTLDSYGVITGRSDVIPDEGAVLTALKGFCGVIKQVPPNYSAIYVGGVRAYALARNDVQTELAAREITVYSFELIGRVDERTFMFDIECGGGTYIRSLARDLALALNTVGYMSSLIRLRSGRFSINEAVTLDELQANGVEKYLLDITYPLEGIARFDAPEGQYKSLTNGIRISCKFDCNELFTVYCRDELFGLAANVDGKLNMKYNLFQPKNQR